MPALPISATVPSPIHVRLPARCRQLRRIRDHRPCALWNTHILTARQGLAAGCDLVARSHPPVFEGHPDLLERFRAGDKDALAHVYRLCRDDVHRLVRAGFQIKSPAGFSVPGLRDSALAEDTVQEVFAKAFTERARASYDGVRPYRPFLLQIARNVRIDQERRRRREVALDDTSTFHHGPADTLFSSALYLSAEAALDWERKRRAARRFVANLDAESQLFFQLRYLEELSQNDVAQRMVVTRRRARTLESRMVSGLRKELQSRRLC